MQALRVALIGKTGTGKSALANSFIEEKGFKPAPQSVSLTKECNMFHSLTGNRTFTVVDTPGILDTKVSQRDIRNEVKKSIAYLSPGPHAFIIVLQAGRITKEDSEVFKAYTNMFGESMLKYTVVVFTHFDHWKTIEGKTRDEAIKDFIKSFPETVNQFFKRIKNRYIMLDIKGEDVENETKALIFAIEQMITDNKNGFYSYQHFIDSRKSQLRAEGLVADENRRQKKKKNRRQLTRRCLQKNIKRTRSSFERETDASMVPYSKRRYNCRA